MCACGCACGCVCVCTHACFSMFVPECLPQDGSVGARGEGAKALVEALGHKAERCYVGLCT